MSPFLITAVIAGKYPHKTRKQHFDTTLDRHTRITVLLDKLSQGWEKRTNRASPCLMLLPAEPRMPAGVRKGKHAPWVPSQNELGHGGSVYAIFMIAFVGGGLRGWPECRDIIPAEYGLNPLFSYTCRDLSSDLGDRGLGRASAMGSSQVGVY